MKPQSSIGDYLAPKSGVHHAKLYKQGGFTEYHHACRGVAEGRRQDLASLVSFHAFIGMFLPGVFNYSILLLPRLLRHSDSGGRRRLRRRRRRRSGRRSAGRSNTCFSYCYVYYEYYCHYDCCCSSCF